MLRCAARRRNPARFGEREEETFLEGAGEKGKRWRTFWVSILGEVLLGEEGFGEFEGRKIGKIGKK